MATPNKRKKAKVSKAKKERPIPSPLKVVDDAQRPTATKLSRQARRKKIREAIELLNDLVKYKVGPSSVHGVGIIAMRDIKKGEKLNMDAIFHQFDIPFDDFTKLRPEVGMHILQRWPLIAKGSHFIYPDAKMSAFCNHSDDPNYDNLSDTATRAIKEGEEIFEDYRNIEGWEEIYTWIAKK